MKKVVLEILMVIRVAFIERIMQTKIMEKIVVAAIEYANVEIFGNIIGENSQVSFQSRKHLGEVILDTILKCRAERKREIFDSPCPNPQDLPIGNIGGHEKQRWIIISFAQARILSMMKSDPD